MPTRLSPSDFHINTHPAALTLMSVREMEPLPFTSQVWKNSLVLSSRAIRPQSEGLLPGVGPRPFTLLSSSMSGTLSSGAARRASGMNFSSFESGIRHEASSLALYPELWGSCGPHGDKDRKLHQVARSLITLWLMNIPQIYAGPCETERNSIKQQSNLMLLTKR